MFGLKERILIVDDQKEIRELIIMLFEDIECIECFVAEDGEQALKILDEFAIHVIVTDIKMPNIDGVELCTTVREKGFKGPVVVVTGEATGSQYRALCQLRISNVYLKPIDLDFLKSELRGILDLEILKQVEAEILESVSSQLGIKDPYYKLSTREKVELLLPAIE
jgi:DNA-binding NtrC family response regulator